MKTAEAKTASSASHQRSNKPFFGKGGNAFFGTETASKESFFTPIQAKLSIGKVNDPYEKEADAMADKVVQRLAEPEVQAKTEDRKLSNAKTSLIQAKCNHCEAEPAAEKEEEQVQKMEDTKQEETKKLNLKPAPDAEAEKTVQKKAAAIEAPVIAPAAKAAAPVSSPAITAAITNTVQSKSSVAASTATTTETKEEQPQEKEEETGQDKQKIHRKPIFDSNGEPPEEENTIQRSKCRECDEGNEVIMPKPMPDAQLKRTDQTPKSDGSRTSIIAAAQGEIGKVEARTNDGAGGRVGGERLLEYFNIAAPGVWDESIISTAGAEMPSWCGIFTVWAHKKAGKDIGEWQMGKGVSAFNTLTNTDDPQPGDIGYIHEKNQHHALVKEVVGDTVHTIDGNSGTNSEVIENSKPRSEYDLFMTAFGGGGGGEVQAKEEDTVEKTQPSQDEASIESRLTSSKGGGSSLSEGTRQDMEQSIGADFSNVHIHTDSSAEQLSSDLNAQAFTHGNDIYFNSGKFDEGSNEGKHLLAHELTHTVQQSGGSVQSNKNEEPPVPATTPAVQRTPEEFDDLLDDAREAWIKSQEEFYKQGNYHDASYSLRVLFLLNNADGAEFGDEEEVEEFIEDCEYTALDEDETLAWLDEMELGDYYYENSPEAFPHTWAQAVWEVLYIEVDDTKLEEAAKKALTKCETVGGKVPAGIMEKGLPVKFQEALAIKKFDFKLSLINSDVNSAVIDLAKAGRAYIAKKWTIGFYITWNAIAQNVYEGIYEGTLVVKPASYTEFLEKQQKGILELADHIASAKDDLAVEKINTDAKNLNTVALLMGMGGTLGGLIVGLFYWKEVRKIFEEKMAEADGQIAGLDQFDKVATALKWAYENGYFGEAGAQLWEAIKDNWKEMLATMAAFVIVQFIPYLNIAVDAVVIIHSGVDALVALKNLTVAFGSAAKANDVISMQREAAKLAKSVTGDGLRLIMDLVGIITGVKGVKAKASSIRSKNPGMSQNEAVEQAVKEQGLKGKMAETVKSTTKVDDTAEIVQKLGGVTAETVENLNNNPLVKQALFENSLAASVLKKCASPCFPPNAKPKQIVRLQQLLDRGRAIDAPLDRAALRKYFYKNRENLDNALTHLEDYMTTKEVAYVKKQMGFGDDAPEPDARFETPQSTKQVRKTGGVATAEELPILGSDWLNHGISQIPGQVASKLKDRYFADFAEFRQTFWYHVSKDTELMKSPHLSTTENFDLVNMGKSPKVPKGSETGKGSNEVYNLDHVTPLKIGGDTYNMSEIYVVVPKTHVKMPK
jgi:hypothetical protein